MSKKILLIVEGNKEEPRILDANGEGILSLVDVDFEIVSFNTSIYELYNDYIDGLYDDLVSYLVYEKGLKIDEGKLPKTAFSAVYLIFDYEPHYQLYSDSKIVELQKIFNDETEMGKLYINYPMVESYYHLTNFPDYDYLDKKITLTGLNGDSYKELVYEESCINHKPIPKWQITSIMHHNYIKAQRICNSDFEIEIDYLKILEKQIELKNQTNNIYILNTMSLMPIDYSPESFSKLLKSKLK